MANWMMTPSQVRALVEQYLLPPGWRCLTTYDAQMDGVLGVIETGAPLGPRAEFRLDRYQLTLSSGDIVGRLAEQIRPQLDVFFPRSPEEPLDLEATG